MNLYLNWFPYVTHVACRFLAFLWNYILHCICFKILFTVSTCLLSNWSYTRLIRTVKKVKKSNKRFKIIRVNIIVCNHYFIILNFIPGHKGLYSVSNKANALKSSYEFSTYDKYNGLQLNWRIANSKSPLSYFGL